jgi:hypothetical protein
MGLGGSSQQSSTGSNVSKSFGTQSGSFSNWLNNLLNFSQQSTSTQTSPYAQALARFGTQQEKTAQPILSLLGSQTLEALRTGGVNAFIPWISRAVDAVRQKGSAGVQGLRQQLARGGFGGTLAGQGAVAQAQQQAGEQAASTPTDLTMQLISGAGPFATGLATGGGGQIAAAQPFAATQTGQTTGTQAGQQQAGGQQYAQSSQSGVNYGQSQTTSTPSFWDYLLSGLQASTGFFQPAGSTQNFYRF